MLPWRKSALDNLWQAARQSPDVVDMRVRQQQSINMSDRKFNI
ncbi:hypothetical protein JCM19233_3387 [Vibrio astriarenae]|nr:hypothetical protein JCM19233_3387 [Vibrio sp. C7]